MGEFVNLHNHFDYSILDGAMKVDGGVERAVQLGQAALAMTDHGTMGGAYAFYKSATSKGVKPIIGCEVYVSPREATFKEPVFWGVDAQRRDDVSGGGKYCHLTLLARTAEGLRNLFRLQHSGYAHGFYGKPRIDLEVLSQHNEGLTILSGCPGGAVQTRIALGQVSEASEYLGRLKDIGNGHTYVEFMDHGIEIEARTRDELRRLATYHNLPSIATGDAHYALPSDKDAHDTLLCVQTAAKKKTVDRFRFDGNSYHLPSYDEVAEWATPDLIRNTLVVAESVEGYGDFFESRVRMPAWSGDDPGYDLEMATYQGLDRLYGEPRRDVLDRAMFELDIINGSGYATYFLVLQEIINEWKSAGIRTGPGRGSAGGSLVAFALGITGIDPLAYGLLFERFLNPERVSLPDIDTDIDDTKRDLALEIVARRFGHTRVINVGTYGTIKAKAALKDASRVLSYPPAVGAKLVSLLPPAKFGREPALSELSPSASPKEVVLAARDIEGFIRSTGVHASAVVVSPDELLDLIPLKLPGGKEERGWCAEFTGEELDELGFVKYDFLGLKTLGVIDECMSLLRESNPSVGLPTTFDDAGVFELLGNGHTAGVFQMDGYGMRNLLRRLRPKSFLDVAAVLALYRPGPMGANAHNEYADRANGRSRLEYPHPEFESSLADALSETHGLIVYQEQVLEILRVTGGYTYATARTIFDAMRKKNTEKMLQSKPEFDRRLRGNGYSQSAITALWDVLVPFSDYSFNKSHSVGYAMVAYWTGWLKVHYPRQFWCAFLSRIADSGKTPKERQEILLNGIRTVMEEGIPILPPDVNESGYGWSVVGDGIRFGIGAIKGISEKTYAALDKGRPYLSLDDFFGRVDSKFLNVGVLKAASQSGLLDTLESNREEVVANVEGLSARALDDRKLATKGQRRLWQSFTMAEGHRRLGLRQEWEEGTLGVALTRRAVNIRLRRPLEENEWLFIHQTISGNYGPQPVNMVMPAGLTTLRSVGQISLSPAIIISLTALGAVDIQEEE